MDLFADLPPPDNEGVLQKTSSVPKITAPERNGQESDDALVGDLFGDLPDPQDQSSCSSTNKGEKRALEEDKDIKHTKRQTTLSSISKDNFLLKGFVAERMGEREDMQDAHVMLDDFKEDFQDHLLPNVSRLAYYAIFDGHAGAQASKFAAKNLHKNIVVKFPKGEVVNKDREIKKCLIDAYRKTDEEFLQEASKHNPPLKDGSTAVSALIVNNVLYVANLGDCKALLCRRTEDGKYGVVPLSKDHSPTQYEERLRIQKSGGNVRDGRVLGILEVSRSFGDGRFKGCGVIATPDVLRCSLNENDRFLLLACDGLWKGFEVDEALAFINNILESRRLDNNKDDEATMTSRYEKACSQIASDAIRKGSSDNVTVILVEIKEQTKN